MGISWLADFRCSTIMLFLCSESVKVCFFFFFFFGSSLVEVNGWNSGTSSSRFIRCFSTIFMNLSSNLNDLRFRGISWPDFIPSVGMDSSGKEISDFAHDSR